MALQVIDHPHLVAPFDGRFHQATRRLQVAPARTNRDLHAPRTFRADIQLCYSYLTHRGERTICKILGSEPSA
ncbi:MAG: hypothetical protein ABGZ37_07415 [Akkermansiaceae bacterium]